MISPADLKSRICGEILGTYPHQNLSLENGDTSLRNLLPFLTIENKKTIGRELISAVQHLHLHGIVHQSISLDVIFLSKLYDVYSVQGVLSIYTSYLSGFDQIDLFPNIFSTSQFSNDVFSLGECLREIFDEIPDDLALFVSNCLSPEPSRRPQLNSEIILPNLHPSPFPIETNVIDYLLSLIPVLDLTYPIVWKTLRLYSILPKRKGIDLPICLFIFLKMKGISMKERPTLLDWFLHVGIPEKYASKREIEILERYMYVLISPCPIEISLIRENLINFNNLMKVYISILRSPLFNMLSTMEISECLLEKSCLPCVSYPIPIEHQELLDQYL